MITLDRSEENYGPRHEVDAVPSLQLLLPIHRSAVVRPLLDQLIGVPHRRRRARRADAIRGDALLQLA